MAISTVKPASADMEACVARFADLQRCETGLPDMQLPECRRAFLNVLGFDQPKGDGQFSPFGDRAKARVSHLKAGFGVSFIAAAPGKGVLMHTHDTVETFMVMKGTWKVEWEGDQGDAHVVLQPLDFIAVPVGVQRRFECLQPAAGEAEGLLLGMIGGNAPAAEIAPSGIERLIEAGIFQREKLAA
ncbi:cupin domain-containing protein [Ramlibacter sp. CGMCC 1.13660]|uniref:cupin domain-containing protein n=1 Tax=Ramlibacter sp. CGMCC 1.13660 TaxID=2755558 RepID=UPI0012F974AB|nr:cupin domain-containing protein [Ramlibacter sp. CGMCC 1.13660]MBA2965674.1 cupin domain-containing protein [Ramlibacter sp. CGMCC 1.13660]